VATFDCDAVHLTDAFVTAETCICHSVRSLNKLRKKRKKKKPQD